MAQNTSCSLVYASQAFERTVDLLWLVGGVSFKHQLGPIGWWCCWILLYLCWFSKYLFYQFLRQGCWDLQVCCVFVYFSFIPISFCFIYLAALLLRAYILQNCCLGLLYLLGGLTSFYYIMPLSVPGNFSTLKSTLSDVKYRPGCYLLINICMLHLIPIPLLLTYQYYYIWIEFPIDSIYFGYLKNIYSREFPGCSAVRTHCFYCCGLGLMSGLSAKISKTRWCSQKKFFYSAYLCLLTGTCNPFIVGSDI